MEDAVETSFSAIINQLFGLFNSALDVQRWAFSILPSTPST